MYCLRKDGKLVGDSYDTIEDADVAAKDLSADEVVFLQPMRTYPRLLTEQQREDLDFSIYEMIDSIDVKDEARAQLYEMSDRDFLEAFYLCTENYEERIAALEKAKIEGIQKILAIIGMED